MSNISYVYKYSGEGCITSLIKKRVENADKTGVITSILRRIFAEINISQQAGDSGRLNSLYRGNSRNHTTSPTTSARENRSSEDKKRRKLGNKTTRDKALTTPARESHSFGGTPAPKAADVPALRSLRHSAPDRKKTRMAKAAPTTQNGKVQAVGFRGTVGGEISKRMDNLTKTSKGLSLLTTIK